jgi:hypothetical protein
MDSAALDWTLTATSTRLLGVLNMIWPGQGLVPEEPANVPAVDW